MEYGCCFVKIESPWRLRKPGVIRGNVPGKERYFSNPVGYKHLKEYKHPQGLISRLFLCCRLSKNVKNAYEK